MSLLLLLNQAGSGATYTLTVDAAEYRLVGRDMTATPVTPDYTLVVTAKEYTLTGRDLTVSDGGAYVPPVDNKGAGKSRSKRAEQDWEAREKWRKLAKEYDFESSPVMPEKIDEPSEAVSLDSLIPRLGEPVLTLSELVSDAKLLNIEQAQALEAAIAVRDLINMSELAYLAELAINQEKEALIAFMMFMD